MEVCEKCGVLLRKNVEKKAWESWESKKVTCRTGGPHSPMQVKAQVEEDAELGAEPTEAELIDWSNWESELEAWTKE